MTENNCIIPNWPAPKNIIAFMTTQRDDLPANYILLNQVHGNKAVQADLLQESVEADACFTDKNNIICVVKTADCLPLLITDTEGKNIAAIHGGWRGLAANIIENTIKHLSGELLVWLGPAIGPTKFEVGEDVFEKFSEDHNAFQKISETKYLCDIYQIAKNRLQKLNIKNIYGGEYCTYTDPRFYSYRRDKTQERMYSLIFKEN